DIANAVPLMATSGTLSFGTDDLLFGNDFNECMSQVGGSYTSVGDGYSLAGSREFVPDTVEVFNFSA
ncbi:hypothetical protein KIPB_014724, partial [Kipferlia bialata]